MAREKLRDVECYSVFQIDGIWRMTVVAIYYAFRPFLVNWDGFCRKWVFPDVIYSVWTGANLFRRVLRSAGSPGNNVVFGVGRQKQIASAGVLLDLPTFWCFSVFL